MYDTYIMKRTQIYLDEEQAQALARRSGLQGVTTSHLIREAIAQYLSDEEGDASELQRQRDAVRAVAGTVPRLPDGAAYVDEIRADDEERAGRLEEAWRSR